MTPPSGLSPDFRARENTARICWRGEAGKPAMRCRFSVAQPVASVATSAGTENCWNGIAVAYTSALPIERPLQAETWKRSCRVVTVRVIGDGEATWPSITSRAGGAI